MEAPGRVRGMRRRHEREANLIFVLPPNVYVGPPVGGTFWFQIFIQGNPHGNRHRTRHLLNQEFMQALLLHFRQHGKKAIEKVARNQPAAYLKILALLVPREMKLEHSGGVKGMTEEQIVEAIEAIEGFLARRAGERAKVIEGEAEVVPAYRRPGRPRRETSARHVPKPQRLIASGRSE